MKVLQRIQKDMFDQIFDHYSQSIACGYVFSSTLEEDDSYFIQNHKEIITLNKEEFQSWKWLQESETFDRWKNMCLANGLSTQQFESIYQKFSDLFLISPWISEKPYYLYIQHYLTGLYTNSATPINKVHQLLLSAEENIMIVKRLVREYGDGKENIGHIFGEIREIVKRGDGFVLFGSP